MDLTRFTSLDPEKAIPQLQALLNRERPKDAFGKAESSGWYRIQNLSPTEAEVYIYDHIGEFGVSADEFVRDFSDIRASKITVRINSPGGVVSDGVSIYNAIRRHKANVTTINDGMAASIASFILMAGNKVIMSPHSQMLIHDAHGLTIGNASDMRETADMLDKGSDNIASVYAKKAGGTVEEWRDLMRAVTLISDAEAVEMGLADEIDGEEPGEIAARADVPVLDHLPTIQALREGTAARRKQPLPDFDFAAGVKEALSV